MSNEYEGQEYLDGKKHWIKSIIGYLFYVVYVVGFYIMISISYIIKQIRK